jgi:hypothetical protein
MRTGANDDQHLDGRLLRGSRPGLDGGLRHHSQCNTADVE